MNIGAKAFSARVHLPCRLFCGGEGGLQVIGTAVSIDTGSVVLELSDASAQHLKIGDVADLELDLPANPVSSSARCLAVRARVAQVVDMQNGTRQMTVQFRKAAFKESERIARKPPKASGGWEM